MMMVRKMGNRKIRATRKAGVFSAITLLEKTLEFRSMTPEPEMWSYAAQRDNPPRFVRLQQLHALLAAFGFIDSVPGKTSEAQKNVTLMPKLQSLLDGTFVRTRKPEDYAELDQYVKQHLDKRHMSPHASWLSLYMEIDAVYSQMVDYKSLLNDLDRFNNGWMEGGLFVLFHIQLTNEITRSLIRKSSELDYVLGMIIDPEKKTFPISLMVKRYNYPSADLASIDSDYF